MVTYKIKRIYDEPGESDGYRVLIDRLWPRGVSKERAALDEWKKDIAPSPDLRIWFGHKPELFKEFGIRYREELRRNPAIEAFKEEMQSHPTVTLLYATHDPKINHAIILCNFLSK